MPIVAKDLEMMRCVREDFSPISSMLLTGERGVYGDEERPLASALAGLARAALRAATSASTSLLSSSSAASIDIVTRGCGLEDQGEPLDGKAMLGKICSRRNLSLLSAYWEVADVVGGRCAAGRIVARKVSTRLPIVVFLHDCWQSGLLFLFVVKIYCVR